MKVLNLYAGLGGNRDLWENVEVTAVEHNEEIAALYQKRYPKDKVVVGDAHQYLLENFNAGWDLIWSSRSCITHSKARFWASKGGRYKPVYPDFGLYEEIVFLKHYADCKHVVENVKPFYEPLVKPTIELDRHLFWTNFPITPFQASDRISPWAITSNTQAYGFDVSNVKINHRKDQLIRNLVNPEIGLHVLQCAFRETEQMKLAI
jgi:DNA (cytosine-5)-methyltransferase 1